MRPIRVFVGPMHRLLRDIVVHMIESESDLQLSGEAADAAWVDALAATGERDVVVVGEGPHADPATLRRLEQEHPNLGLLVLSSDGRSAELRSRSTHRIRCADVSPSELVRLVRSARALEG